MPEPQNKASYNFSLLHAIRGVAALYVVVFHAKFILWCGGGEYLKKYPREHWNIFDYFSFGIDLFSGAGVQMVMLFFVLSGFFIAMTLDKKDEGFGSIFKRFYPVRFIRIYIPYLASIAFAVIILLVIKQAAPELFYIGPRDFNTKLFLAYNDLTLSNFFKSLLFMRDTEYIGCNYVYWSLLYEAIFYLVIPFFIKSKKYFFLLSALIYAISVIFKLYNYNFHLWKYIFEFNFYFALGIFIYHSRQQVQVFCAKHNIKILLLISAAIFTTLFIYLALKDYIFYADFFSGVTAALLIITILCYPFKTNFFTRMIIWLGKISFSLYLVHLPVLFSTYLIIYKITGITVFYQRYYFIGVLAAILVAWLFYKAVEKPSLKVIGKLKSSKA